MEKKDVLPLRAKGQFRDKCVKPPGDRGQARRRKEEVGHTQPGAGVWGSLHCGGLGWSRRAPAVNPGMYLDAHELVLRSLADGSSQPGHSQPQHC